MISAQAGAAAAFSRREPLADYLANREYISSSQLRRLERFGDAALDMQTGPRFEGSVMGEALHALLLEPETFERQYLVLDGSVPRGAEVSEDEAMAREWLDVLQWVALRKARDAVLGYQAAPLRRWLDEGEKELSIYWGAGGGQWKARPDCFTREIVLDVKTTTDCRADAFARQRERLRYDYQAAHYLEAVEALTGARARFAYIAVELAPPYPVMLHELSGAELAAARDALQPLKQRCLSILAEASDSGRTRPQRAS